MLNATFESKLASEDEGYKSSSENFNIPTPLQKCPDPPHFSTKKGLFWPNSSYTTHHQISTTQTCMQKTDIQLLRWWQHHRRLGSFPFQCITNAEHTHDAHALPSKHHLEAPIHWKEEEEDFQTVLLDDEHWTTEEIPDRPLCIHEHLLPHGLCPYPCPYVDYQTPSYYEAMDLSDISKFKDVMTTSQWWGHPRARGFCILKRLWFELNIYTYVDTIFHDNISF